MMSHDNKGFEDPNGKPGHLDLQLQNVDLNCETCANREKNGQNNRAETQMSSESDILYKVDDVPPWHLSLLLGFQHYLTMFGSTVSIPFIICPALCIEEDDQARGYLISTLFFVSGIVTLMQTTFGVRLPIVQGSTFSFLAPTFAILALPRNQCPADFATNGWGSNYTQEEKTEEWQMRIREVQGAVIVASIFQLIMGYFGIIGIVLHYITPLTIAPAVTMIGLALFPAASGLASKNWLISMLTVLIMIIFSLYLRDINFPMLKYKRGQGCITGKLQVFKLFPVLLAIVFMWALCAILTAADVFPENNSARTDLKLQIIYNSNWIRIPYPFQWGWPVVTVAGVFGMFAGVLASAIESIGDYYACARLSGAPPPPTHAINRGIGTEGLGCILAGIWGTGNGTTSYSENIGAIGVTKVASRRVVQMGALLMIIFGLFAKFGAFFVTIPEPIVGGIFTVMFGVIAAVGLSNLQFVDMNSSRNLFILGFSIFFALMLPKWIAANKDVSFSVGVDVLDQILKILLETSMFVAGAIGFILDNTVPGTDEERGLTKWRAHIEVSEHSQENSTEATSTYDFPIGMEQLRRMKWTKFIPSSPTYEEPKKRNINLPCRKK